MYTEELIQKILEGGVVVMPTDTVYGVVAKASIPEAVEKMYEVKKRDLNKQFVFLISSVSQLNDLGVSEYDENILNEYWPGPYSFEMNSNISYLHRGNGYMAIRMPDNEELRELISKTGPLATSSANLQGEDIAINVEEAKNQLGDIVDMYVDGGEVERKSSKILKVVNREIKILRD